MDNLYNKILSLCKEKGISGGKMCTEIGLSRSFMTELKMGRARSINMNTAKKLSDYFGVSPEYFVKEEAPDSSSEADAQRRRIISLFESLSEDDRANAEKYLKFLADNAQMR